MFTVPYFIEFYRAEEQRARRVQAFLLYRKQSSQRLARFAPHCMNEADSANNPSMNSTTKAFGNLQCGANAKRASALFAAFDGKILTATTASLSEPSAPLRDKNFHTRNSNKIIKIMH